MAKYSAKLRSTAPRLGGQRGLAVTGADSYTPGVMVNEDSGQVGSRGLRDGRDPMALKEAADDVVERAAEGLRALLQQAVARLRPFPSFPGAFFTNAIEAEPNGAADPSRGCVVV